jgi:UDP-N-acetylenolpyruvoylglucosamine reductase
VRDRSGTPLSELTTLRVGGPAQRLVEVETEGEIVEAVREADDAGDAMLVMGGGSNLLVADEGFPGTVVRVASRGTRVERSGELARIVVAAGEPWDELVVRCVSDRLAGLECLSGIPGLTGATPIQNVGAYGQEVAQTLISVRAYDRQAAAVVELGAEQCGFGYRTSAFKGSARHVVLAVSFELEHSPDARPIRYPELARALGVQTRARATLEAVREAVLGLRRSKGMVLDPTDPDSVSAGSFFLNPLLAGPEAEELKRRARRRLGDEVAVPLWPEGEGMIKVSAAWLIQQAGFSPGFGEGRAGISTKHTLALVNRGGASATEVVQLARELRDSVRDAFGVTLTPEPRLIGLTL